MHAAQQYLTSLTSGRVSKPSSPMDSRAEFGRKNPRISTDFPRIEWMRTDFLKYFTEKTAENFDDKFFDRQITVDFKTNSWGLG